VTPEGTYTVELYNATVDMTKLPRVLLCTWKILSKDNNVNGDKLFQRFRFVENCKKFNQWQLGILGVWSQLKGCNSDEAASDKAADLVFALVGKFAEAKVSHREYKGKTYTDMILEDFIGDTVLNGPEEIDSQEELPF